jgi:hypothetical protein
MNDRACFFRPHRGERVDADRHRVCPVEPAVTPFLVGFVMGAAFIACGFVIFLTRKPAARVPDPWAEEYHQAPQVTTRILVNRREISL